MNRLLLFQLDSHESWSSAVAWIIDLSATVTAAGCDVWRWNKPSLPFVVLLFFPTPPLERVPSPLAWQVGHVRGGVWLKMTWLDCKFQLWCAAQAQACKAGPFNVSFSRDMCMLFLVLAFTFSSGAFDVSQYRHKWEWHAWTSSALTKQCNFFFAKASRPQKGCQLSFSQPWHSSTRYSYTHIFCFS